jgi:hypothetical protein
LNQRKKSIFFLFQSFFPNRHQAVFFCVLSKKSLLSSGRWLIKTGRPWQSTRPRATLTSCQGALAMPNSDVKLSAIEANCLFDIGKSDHSGRIIQFQMNTRKRDKIAMKAFFSL